MSDVTIGMLIPFIAVGASIGIPLFSMMLRAESRLKRIETIVEGELRRNGGSSLHDRIVRMEAEFFPKGEDSLRQRVHRIEAQLQFHFLNREFPGRDGLPG